MKRDIVIDADHIAYNVANSKSYQYGFKIDDEAEDDDADWGSGFDSLVTDRHRKHFQSIIDDYITTIEVEAIINRWKLSGKVRVIMSDQTNFRFDIYDKYKEGRPDNTQLLSELKEWARGHYHFEPNTEADDVVAYYVRKGAIGVTTDKDLFKGVAGIWYNSHYKHKTFIVTTPQQAEHFFKCQIIGGDGVDNIPSIKGVAVATAAKLMKKHGNGYQDIAKLFELKGYTKKYMITMARLVSMSQWSPKKGVRLWKIPKD